jgi:cell division protein FtsL
MKKKKRRYRDPKILATGFILMGIFMGELLFYTWCRVQCVQIKYEISQETQRHQYLVTLRDNLKIELAHLKSPQRIATIAKNRLGLTKPTPRQMVPIP